MVNKKILDEFKLIMKQKRLKSKIDSHHHDHMICSYCNKIIEFVNSDIEDLQDKVAKTNNFILERHSLQLFGKCKDCQ